MAGITLSKAVRTNLLSLQNTSALMSKTQERLATGLKVNSALDNPSNFFTAAGLNARANDMNSLLDSMMSGIKVIEAASNGLSSMTKTVESMQSTLRQARSDKSFQTKSYELDSSAADGSVFSFTGGAVGDTAVNVELTKHIKTGVGGFQGPAGTIGAAGDLTIQTASLNAGAAVTVSGILATDDVDSVVNKINTTLNNLAGGNGGVTAKNVDGQIQLQNYNGDSITVAEGTADEVAQRAGLVSGAAITAVTATTAAAAGGLDFGAATAVDADVIGESITLTSTLDPSVTATYTFTAADLDDQLTAMQTAFGAAGFSVADSGGVGLQFTRADGQNFTVTTSDATTETGTMIGTAALTSAAPVTSTAGVTATTAITVTASAKSVKTVDELVNEINKNDDLEGKIRAANDSGKLRIENLSTQELTVGGVGANGLSLNGSTDTDTIGGNQVRKNLVTQFNQLRDQLDKFSDDASFDGINLLRGDKLKLTFNETGTSQIEIRAQKQGEDVQINNTTLGIETVEEEDFDSDASIDARLDTLKTALEDLRSYASNFGSNLSVVENRQNFTKSMINTLQTGADNLTLADTNEEAANLLALQTRQQLSSTALSMASQTDQNVLQLF